MYCSPAGAETFKKEKTCFSKPALVRLVQAWNESNPNNRIKGVSKMDKMGVWNALNKKMSTLCSGDGKEACWVDTLEGPRPSQDIAKSLRPVQPKEWTQDEYTWLTNYDIEDVMEQYDYAQNQSYKYKFLGVYPIDFQAKNVFGTCLFQEFCTLNVASFYKKGIRYVGLITNLDKHDQDGSHWTSLFICIDPSLPSFGAYYYDSVAMPPPSEITRFMETVREQVKVLPGADKATFNIQYNRKKHQFKNTECGVFSMAYQLRWLTLLKDNPATMFKKVVEIDVRDEDVHKLRSVLYRPRQRGGKKGNKTLSDKK
jgi:hypothetical protein